MNFSSNNLKQKKYIMRINKIYAYFYKMKARLNLTVDNSILQNIKSYAIKHHTSVSELVENYFLTLAKEPKRKNIIEIIESLDTPTIGKELNLKDLYYKEQSNKYGI